MTKFAGRVIGTIAIIQGTVRAVRFALGEVFK